MITRITQRLFGAIMMGLLFAVGAVAQTCPTFSSNDPAVVRTAAVDSAIASVQGAGADVGVVVVERAGGLLSALAKTMQDGCSNWHAVDGGRKNNLVLIVVATKERRTGIYYGSQWDEALSKQWPRIESRIAAPRFRDGDIAGGIAAALKEISVLLTADSSRSQTTVLVQPAQATDLSGLWSFLMWTLGAVVLFWMAIAIGKYRARRRAEEEERSGAQQAALIAQQEASALVIEMSQIDRASEAWAIVQGALERYQRLGMGATDPANGLLSASQYRAIQESYSQVVKSLESAKRKLRGEPEPVAPAVNEEDQKEREVYESHGYRRERVHHQQPSVVIQQDTYLTPVSPIFVPMGGGDYPVPMFTGTPDPPRTYAPPEPAAPSGGGDSDWGSSASSDSGGGSCDSGSSDASSGGGDSSW